MRITLLVGCAALFFVSTGFLFYFRDTIDDSIWFIPLLSGAIIGFTMFIAVLRRGVQEEYEAKSVPGRRKTFTVLWGGFALLVGLYFAVTGILSRHYLYFVPSDTVWAKIQSEPQYRGKCYTRSIDHTGIHCVGTGYDEILEVLLFISRKSSRNILQ